MKTYVLTLSQVFPATHPRKGEPTDFRTKMLSARYRQEGETLYTAFDGKCKLHTIRCYYDLWRKRFDEIEAGRAYLSVRQWEGKPYASKQVEIMRLYKEDGIGLQKMFFGLYSSGPRIEIDGRHPSQVAVERVANNDGLTKQDWIEWFKDHDGYEPLAIIHFTKFRY